VRLLLVSQAAATGPGAVARVAALGRLLPRPRAVFSSPAAAAVQTARALGPAVTVVDELRAWEPDAESPDELLARALAWVDMLATAHGTQAAVADAATVRAAVAAAVDAPELFARLEIAPCSVSELGFRQGRWHLVRVNWEPALLHIPQRRGRRRSSRSQEY
jgi:broad specificity phosphatase PhoE